MTKSLFVTATGTDIGKTYISGLLVKKMRDYGFNCGYFKPVLSGAERNSDGELVPGDCKFVVDTAKLDCKPLDCLSYCFEEAISPHLASKRLGVEICLSKIETDYENLQKIKTKNNFFNLIIIYFHIIYNNIIIIKKILF